MQTANTRASLLMAASMAGFTINDIIIKGVSDRLGTGEIMAIRGLILFTLLSAFMRWRAIAFPVALLRNRMVWLRTAGEVVATMTFLYALARVPIASVSAVLQTLPLVVTLGAAVFFGEHIGWRRLSAIAIGLFGVLLILKPGMGLTDPVLFLVVGTVIAAAMRDLATRALPDDIPSLGVSHITAGAVAAFGALSAPFTGGWTTPTATELATLGLASLFLFIGYQGIVMAMRLGETAVVAPFRYTSLVWSILLGYLIYSETPDMLSMVGAVLIVAAGIYAFWREARLARSHKPAGHAAASPPPARGT